MNTTILKYISYGFGFFWVLSNEVFWAEGFPVGFMMLLIWVVLSQFRANYIQEKKSFFWLTVVLEISVVILLFYRYGGLYSVYLLPVFLDIVIISERWRDYIPMAFLSAGLFIFYFADIFSVTIEPAMFVTDLLILVIVLIFSLILDREKGRKELAQTLYDQLRISEEKLQEAYETLEKYSQTIEELTLLRERARISRELHDSVGHALSTTGIQLQAIEVLIKKDPEKATTMIKHLIDYSKASLENVRRTVKQMRPIEFEHYEGVFVIEELVKKFKKLTGLDIHLICSKTGYPMNSDQSHQLYRIVQECLSNSVRHGKAKKIQISIQFLSDSIYSQIKDDGVGCAHLTFGMGLSGIKERVDSLKGEMNVFTQKGEGFEITIKLPRRISEEVKA